MSVERQGQEFLVTGVHPCLPGHFPDDPVVPGVLLLDEVLAAAGTLLGREAVPRALVQVKFLHALRPTQRAQISLSIEGQKLRFSIDCADRAVARGEFELA